MKPTVLLEERHHHVIQGQHSSPSLAAVSDRDFADWRDKEFAHGDMTGARFTTVRLSGATFLACELNEVVLRGAEMVDTTGDGKIQSLASNGVGAAPSLEACWIAGIPTAPSSDRRTPRGSGRPGTSTSG